MLVLGCHMPKLNTQQLPGRIRQTSIKPTPSPLIFSLAGVCGRVPVLSSPPGNRCTWTSASPTLTPHPSPLAPWQVYMDECQSKVGFSTTFRATTRPSTSDDKDKDKTTFDQFTKLVYR